MKPIIATICLVLSFGIIFFAAWPEYQSLRDSMLQAQIKDADLANMINYSQAMKQIVERLDDEHKDDIKKIEDGLPDDNYIPSMFAEIRRISYRTGVRIDGLGNFSVGKYQKRDGIEQVEISFQVQGSYSNFKNFLKELKNSARLFDLVNLTINKTRDEEDEILSYRLTLISYSK